MTSYALFLFGTEIETLVQHHLCASSGTAALHNAHRVRSIVEDILEEAIAGGHKAISNCLHTSCSNALAQA